MIPGLRRLLHRTPVAWLQVSHNPVKLTIALAGVSFSNLLMFFQLGLLDSIYNSQRKPIQKLRADLVMVSAGYSNLGALQTFDRSRLYQALGVAGVEGVAPLRMARATWITPETHRSFDVTVYGINLSRPSLAFPELEGDVTRLQPLRNALFDRRAKAQYGAIATTVARQGSAFVEVNHLIVSDSTYFFLFPSADPRLIQLGLIQLRPGVDARSVQQALQPLMPGVVKVLTRQELETLELNYWKRNSSVGFIFTLGVLVGFVVGSIIVYQILFGDVMNSLPQYATLKAMGYTDFYVISVVIQQSAILAFVGFVPGVLSSMGLYWLLATVTKLSVYMTVERALQVLLLTFVMCVGSGALATRKLVQLDPADVF